MLVQHNPTHACFIRVRNSGGVQFLNAHIKKGERVELND